MYISHSTDLLTYFIIILADCNFTIILSASLVSFVRVILLN